MLLLCCSDRPETDYYYCVVRRGHAEYIEIPFNHLLCASASGGLRFLDDFAGFTEPFFEALRDGPDGEVQGRPHRCAALVVVSETKFAMMKLMMVMVMMAMVVVTVAMAAAMIMATVMVVAVLVARRVRRTLCKQ